MRGVFAFLPMVAHPSKERCAARGIAAEILFFLK